MADEAALKALTAATQGPVHNSAWQNYKDQHKVVDLSQADLSNRELLDFDFRDCNLAAAKFFNSDLAGSDLTGANLTYADMRRVNLANAFLTSAQASGADLSGANLVDTNLDNADLRGARMGGAHLVGASLTNANIAGADLRGANLKFTNLGTAVLDGANVDEATMVNVEIPEAAQRRLKNFDKAIISGKSAAAQQAKKRLTADEDYADLFLEQDCYRILGVDKEAALEDITKAYRQRAKEYHPDRVHHLGEKIRIVAGREFERINHAYKSLSQHKVAPAQATDTTENDPVTLEKPPEQYTLQDFVSLARQHPNNDKVFYNLGIAYFRNGDHMKAIQAFQRSLKINPLNKAAAYNMRVAMMLQAVVQK
jgi:uncharacterized protein YjbI with pentapeptide repeats